MKEKWALLYSGGRDSHACLKLLRTQGRLHATTIVWVNTGDAWPETIEWMNKIRATWPNFFEVKTDVRKWTLEHGIPADVVHVGGTELGAMWNWPNRTRRHVLGPECCFNNIIAPLWDNLKHFGFTHVVRGDKYSDRPRGGAKDGEVYDGITFSLPIADWSDDAVNVYLGDELPPQYLEGCHSSLDCLHCTAFGHEWHGGRGDYLSQKHPSTFLEVAKERREIQRIARRYSHA